MKLRFESANTPFTINGSTIPDARNWDGIQQIADRLAYGVIPDHPDGFTFCARTRRCLFLTASTESEQYVVSVAGCERTFQGAPSTKQIVDWLVVHEELVQKPGYYIGGWRDQGVFFLDVSILVTGFERAIELGRVNCQLTIYHPASMRVLEVSQKSFEVKSQATAN